MSKDTCGEACSCHEHGHEHGPHCEHDAALSQPGRIHTEYHLHDDAVVISGSLTLDAEYGALRSAVERLLEHFALEVRERGGIVGHIKASCETTSVEMFSVTDVSAMAKKAPVDHVKITLAAIVFLVPPEEMTAYAGQALTGLRDSFAPDAGSCPGRGATP